MLQFLDKLPPLTAIYCTTNNVDKLTDRFQSRFQVVGVPALTPPQISDFLMDRWPSLGPGRITEIATSCNGDVRAALNDTQSFLDFEAQHD